MRRRILQLLLALALLAGILLIAELAFFRVERAAAVWSWPRPRPEALRFDARLGFTARAGTAGPAADEPALLVVADRLLGSVSRPAGRSAALARRLADHGILAVDPVFADAPWANTTQRALAVRPAPGSVVVLALSGEDVARDDRTELAGYPLPVLEARQGHVVAAGLTRQAVTGPFPLARLAARLPALRFVLCPVDRVPLAGKPGLLPAELWPYRRRGVPDETARWKPALLALRYLDGAARAAGARLVVLWLPSPLAASNDSLSVFLAALALDTADVEPARPSRRARDECARLGVAFADATAAIRRGATRGSSGFRTPDGGVPTLGAELDARGRNTVFGVLAGRLRRLLGP